MCPPGPEAARLSALSQLIVAHKTWPPQGAHVTWPPYSEHPATTRKDLEGGNAGSGVILTTNPITVKI